MLRAALDEDQCRADATRTVYCVNVVDGDGGGAVVCGHLLQFGPGSVLTSCTS